MADILAYLKTPTVLVGGFTITMLVAVVMVLILTLAFLAVRGTGLKYKVSALAIVPLVFVTTAVALVAQLSHPRELSLSWLQSQGESGVAIHASVVHPPKRIHLWIDVDGDPRAFFVAWSKELEKSLQAARKKSKDGRKGQLRFRFEPSLEEDPQFYSMPWPAPEPKDVPKRQEPYRFEHDA